MDTQKAGMSTAFSTKKAVLALFRDKKVTAPHLVRLLGVNWRTADKMVRGESQMNLEQLDTFMQDLGLRVLFVSEDCLAG